jgi:cholesterol oxidase
METTRAPAIGFTFRETMAGHVGAGADYADGQASGLRTGEHLRFRVAVRVADFNAFLADEEHEAGMDGTIHSTSLGDGLRIEGGSFKLFARDGRGHRTMQYRLPFTTADGTACLLEGFKDVHNDRTFDFWYDTTALFTSLHAPGLTGPGDEPFRGILRIRAIDLVPQVWSMRAVNTRNPGRHALVLGRFGLFFAGQMLDEYRPRLRRSRNGQAP